MEPCHHPSHITPPIYPKSSNPRISVSDCISGFKKNSNLYSHIISTKNEQAQAANSHANSSDERRTAAAHTTANTQKAGARAHAAASLKSCSYCPLHIVPFSHPLVRSACQQYKVPMKDSPSLLQALLVVLLQAPMHQKFRRSVLQSRSGLSFYPSPL